jgi:Secretion system C-terminal sorting domain
MDQAMRTALLTPLFFFSTLLSAQVWCPTGAEWTYTFTDNWTTTGFARFNYAGDTIIGGANCQRIDQYIEAWYYPLDTLLSTQAYPIFTKVDDDLVSILTTTGFDTLYYFGAVPGDHWQVTLEEGGDGYATINVTDTGTQMIDGEMLHYVVAGQDTMFERLGSLSSFMIPWLQFIIDAAGGPLRCYQDADINYQAPWWTFGCTSWLEVIEPHGSAPPTAFPNPGTDQFTLALHAGAHTITLFDATGRMAIQQQMSGEQIINTAALPSGIYAVRIDEDVRCLHWVKE